MSKLFYSGVRAHRRLNHVADGGLVFGVDNGAGRLFLRFNTFDDFEPWYIGLPPHAMTLSEVVTSDKRKLILDIDSPDGALLEKLLMYDFERHVTSRIHDVFFLLDIGEPEVMFYSMCSDDKISYHVVVSNYMFSAQTCFGLCAIISYGQVWENCVDMGVYKKVQFIRTEKSTKFGECRWKEKLTEPGSLRQGILSDSVGTQVSDFATFVCYNSWGARCLCPSPAQDCWEDASFKKHIYNQFKAGKPSKNGIIPLYRTKPGFCVQCKRSHDRENAFIKYHTPSVFTLAPTRRDYKVQGLGAKAGFPVFMCWRHYTCKN